MAIVTISDLYPLRTRFEKQIWLELIFKKDTSLKNISEVFLPRPKSLLFLEWTPVTPA